VFTFIERLWSIYPIVYVVVLYIIYIYNSTLEYVCGEWILKLLDILNVQLRSLESLIAMWQYFSVHTDLSNYLDLISKEHCFF